MLKLSARHQRKLVKLCIEEGNPATVVADDLGVPKDAALKYLKSKGWTRKSTTKRKKSPKPLTKRSEEFNNEAVIKLLKDGTPPAEVARQAGVSRERIRQIANNAGLEKASIVRQRKKEERLAQQAKEKKQAQEQRAKAKEEAWNKLHEMWNNGLSIADMAKETGRSVGGLQVAICTKRKKDPEWFKSRKGK